MFWQCRHLFTRVFCTILYHHPASSKGRIPSSPLVLSPCELSHQPTVHSFFRGAASTILHGSHPWSSLLKPSISSPTRGGASGSSVRDHHRVGRNMGRTFLADHSLSSRVSSLHSRRRLLSSNRSEIHFCHSSDCLPRTMPLNSRRSCGASDLGLSANLTPLTSDIKNEPISWKSKLRLSSTSRVPSTQSPERSVSRSQISQQRCPLCLTQNQHAPAVQSGKITVNHPPHCSHNL